MIKGIFIIAPLFVLALASSMGCAKSTRDHMRREHDKQHAKLMKKDQKAPVAKKAPKGGMLKY